MKLINNTKIPDPIIRAVVMAAAKGMKLKTGPVVVQITTGRGWRGRAHNYCKVKWGKGKNRRWVKCNGAFKTCLPTRMVSEAHEKYPPAVLARKFFDTCRHEWGHIKDFQGKPFLLDWSRTKPGQAYNENSAESRANDHMDTAEQTHPMESFAPQLDALAAEMERIYGPQAKHTQALQAARKMRRDWGWQ